jgi:hypothetical protein
MINDFYKLKQNETAISRSLNKLAKKTKDRDELLHREDTGNRLTDYWVTNTYTAVDTYIEYLRYKHPETITKIFDNLTNEEAVEFYYVLQQGAEWLLICHQTAGFPLLMEWITFFTDKYLLENEKDYKKHKNIREWIKYLKELESIFNDEN